MARLLGIDHGTRRVGLALADDRDGFVVTRPAAAATPAPQLFRKLQAMVREDRIDRIVVGLPRSLAGAETRQAQLVRAFVRQLRAIVDVPVETADERLTTALARRLGRRRDDDSAAAALLLTAYLERANR